MQAKRDADRVFKRLAREPRGGQLVDLHLVCAELAAMGPKRAAAALGHLRQRWKRLNGDFTKFRDGAGRGLLNFAAMPANMLSSKTKDESQGPEVDDAQLAALIPVLLEAGADIDGDEVARPLFSCVQPERLQQLIDAGADVNVTDSIGWTCLHYAAVRGDESSVRALLAAGALVPDSRLAAAENPPIAELLRVAYHQQRLAKECSGGAQQRTGRL